MPVWVAIAAADRYTAAQREVVAEWGAAITAGRTDRVMLVTCHRVEVYGRGDPPAGPVAVIDGPAAIRHLCRLAAGLESAVLGENEVLHQVRIGLAQLLDGHGDALLIRLFELAVGAGRRARAEHPEASRDLGEIAIRWLESRAGDLARRPVVVVGAGRIGRLVAVAAARRQPELIVASRTLDRAAELVTRVGGRAVDLESGAEAAASAAAVAVALAGPWLEFEATSASQPVVDLSFPASISPVARAALGESFADVDRMFLEAPALGGTSIAGTGFVRAAEAIVDEAVDSYLRWSAGRQSIETLRSLRTRADERRRAELDRLLRRLPDLDPRQQDLVAGFSERLVAGLLHEPSAALREDLDGSTEAAARQLFRL